MYERLCTCSLLFKYDNCVCDSPCQVQAYALNSQTGPHLVSWIVGTPYILPCYLYTLLLLQYGRRIGQRYGPKTVDRKPCDYITFRHVV